MSSNNANWESMQPFGIDNGELDGLSPQDCFVRGFEIGSIWGACTQHVSKSGTIKMVIHSDNEARCIQFAECRGFSVTTRAWLNDDWIELVIDPKEERPQ